MTRRDVFGFLSALPIVGPLIGKVLETDTVPDLVSANDVVRSWYQRNGQAVLRMSAGSDVPAPEPPAHGTLYYCPYRQCLMMYDVGDEWRPAATEEEIRRGIATNLSRG